MSFKKETEKIVLLQVKGRIHIIVKFRTKNIAYFYHFHQSSFWEGHN